MEVIRHRSKNAFRTINLSLRTRACIAIFSFEEEKKLISARAYSSLDYEGRGGQEEDERK
jgi:hypothetical protein